MMMMVMMMMVLDDDICIYKVRDEWMDGLMGFHATHQPLLDHPRATTSIMPQVSLAPDAVPQPAIIISHYYVNIIM